MSLKDGDNFFTRFESDFSLAIIGAALKCFFNLGIKEYLDQAWDVYFERQEPFAQNYHVCRVHVQNALRDQAKKHFGTSSTCLFQINYWISRFVISTSLGAIIFRLQKLFTLCGNKWTSPKTDAAKTTWLDPVPGQFIEGTR